MYLYLEDDMKKWHFNQGINLRYTTIYTIMTKYTVSNSGQYHHNRPGTTVFFLGIGLFTD